MNKIFGFAVLTLCFAACQNSGNEGRVTTNATPAATPTFSAPVTAAQADSGQQTTTGTPVTTTPAAATMPAQTTADKGALNPAHGMPGHRCDIPEGAPLNSAPISTNIPANASPVQSMMQPPPPPPSGSSAKLNPPHGQPGHDCAVPVGQPLKS